MKLLLTITTLSLYAITIQAEVVNGFEKEKIILESAIMNNKMLLLEPTTKKEQKRIERDIEHLYKRYRTVVKKYLQTTQLIEKITKIDPKLFMKVSNITNAEGTPTNVYVRYVSKLSKEYRHYEKKHFKADAYTGVGQSKDNKHMCVSKSGFNSITITVGYCANEIKALAHEFAHVLYIVPNIDSYVTYWNQTERTKAGHKTSDPGYELVTRTENAFIQNYIKYVKENKDSNDDIKIASRSQK